MPTHRTGSCAFCSISFPESPFPLTSGRKNELWEQPFQACAIHADCAVKPDGQNSVISYVISRWLLPELSFSDRWSRETKTLGTRLRSAKNLRQAAHPFDIRVLPWVSDRFISAARGTLISSYAMHKTFSCKKKTVPEVNSKSLFRHE